MGSDNIESLNGAPNVPDPDSKRSKETKRGALINAEDLYGAGKRIEEAISICKLLQSDSMFEAAYRYAKLVDYSEKKHECSNAKALIKITELECKDDVKAAKLKRMFQITLASSNGL